MKKVRDRFLFYSRQLVRNRRSNTNRALHTIDNHLQRADDPAVPKAYLYARFSTAEQAAGDSSRRQRANAEQYVSKTGDELICLPIDSGLSAYHGVHLTGSLGDFLERVKSGVIERGSKLLLENFDRLSRQHHSQAIRLFQDLVDAGITVVTLHSGKEYKAPLTLIDMMMALIELDLGWQESDKKSQRIKSNWAAMRENGTTMTSLCPLWLKPTWTPGERMKPGMKFEPIPERVKLLRRIFRMLADGIPAGRVARQLNEDAIPTWDGAGRRASSWGVVYIYRLHTNRAVLGEFQPRTIERGVRVPIGKPLTNYYPQVIDDELWEAAQAARKAPRSATRSRTDRNLFRGLVWSGDDGTKMSTKEVTVGDTHYVYLLSSATRAGTGNHTISYSKFESVMLAWIMLTAPKLMKKADPIQAHMDALDEAQAALAAAEKKLSSLLDLVESGGFTPDIRARVALRTSERDAARGRVALLEGKKPVTAKPINLMQLKTQEDRQRARGELARLIERVEVVGDMEEIHIRSMWFKPVILTPDGVPVGVEIKNRKGFRKIE